MQAKKCCIVFIAVGLFVGSIVNMLLVQLGLVVVPPPAGVDMTTPEGIKAAMPFFNAQNFIFPFLAHAVGTLVGAFIATRWSGTAGRMPAIVVACFFFVGGLASTFMLPGAPTWFIAADLVLAYFPMSLLGHNLGRRSANDNS